jgi:GTP pyrophosphokinase
MDRLHNMKTLEHVQTDKQRRIAMETLEIYAPIADRLGMGRLKRDLDDLAFPFVNKEAYEEMRRIMREREEVKEDRLEKLLRQLRKELAEHGIRNFRTEYRIKGLFSLYQKLLRKNMELEKIHDILALRVIVPSVEDCYRALGVVHALWRPLPGKIKDYIAFPKPNGYKCIHTTIFTGDGLVIEIQLRTEEMHRRAQFGIASHLSYKETQTSGLDKSQDRTNRVWIRQLIPSLLNLSWNRSATAVGEPVDIQSAPITSRAPDAPRWIEEIAQAHSDDPRAQAFMESLRQDFFSHRVFVFTPKGDVIDLPIDSSPIDFAYAVHSDIGNHISGVKVNGKLASLGTSLKNGDIVEVETRPSSAPTRKWLEYARTSLAKKHIQSALLKQVG